ncbi:MAG: MFS transporter [Legionellales bacterium]|nr:MFS transporter [Legionellales bacterium]|tara:strand:- start:381 stop:1628 length:1248 start_codon:yes stop_codon:yes gene_type:complete
MYQRFKVIVLTVAAVFICYLDRVVISLAIIPMSEEAGWSETHKGIVLGSFYIGYMLTQIYGGVLSDRMGAKIVLGVGLLVWSLFTLITPWAFFGGFIALIIARIGMGLGEGITFPAWHSLYARWIPFSERARSVAITNSAIPIGTIFGLVVTPIIILNLGWQWAFYLYGGLGFIWYVFWENILQSTPKEDNNISPEELDFILNNAPASEKADTLPFSKLISNLPLWAITVAHFCSNYSLFVFLSWLPMFIKDGLGIPMATVGVLAMLPHIAFFLFVNTCGYFADYLTNKGMNLLTVRKLFNSIAFGGSGVCLCIIPELETVTGIITVMCLGNVFGGFSAGGFIVNHADIGPKHTGRLMGITNMVAALPGLVGGVLTGIILDTTHSWDMVFYVVAGVSFFGGIFYFLFASTEKQFD